MFKQKRIVGLVDAGLQVWLKYRHSNTLYLHACSLLQNQSAPIFNGTKLCLSTNYGYSTLPKNPLWQWMTHFHEVFYDLTKDTCLIRKSSYTINKKQSIWCTWGKWDNQCSLVVSGWCIIWHVISPLLFPWSVPTALQYNGLEML